MRKLYLTYLYNLSTYPPQVSNNYYAVLAGNYKVFDTCGSRR